MIKLKKKKIVILSLFIIFLLLMLPSVSSMQSNTVKDVIKNPYFKEFNIPPYIWFAIFILILSLANLILKLSV